MKKIEEYVTSIPDFPEPGIIFRDITSVIGDPDGLKLAIDSLDGLLEGYSDGRMNRTEESFFAWEKWPMWRLYVSTALHAVQLGQLPMKWILPMRFVTEPMYWKWR